ncbi:MAG: ABC transporter ATP-binding protein [Bacilli bacterium]|nr:ABC transporter ATP-binding protein [Bacilli bacterium]
MNAIEIINLTKYYGKNRGIIDVSLQVKEKSIFGFIGPNGSGKSTTIRTILNLIHPSSGEAYIFGKNCEKEYNEILKDVGYLPSEVFYYSNMKVIDLLKYSASFYKKNCDDRINYLSKIMNLDLTKKIEDLSFGNKKKVGIVQALLHSPKLLILDEPTSGLDPLIQQNFFNLLKEENKKGMTIFFSSHVLSEVQKICDEVAIIKEGRIIKIEKINNINNNNYKRIKIEVNYKIDDTFFNNIEVTNLIKEKNIYTFMYKGEINSLITKLSKIDIINIWIDEPSLEEIFMHYYDEKM